MPPDVVSQIHRAIDLLQEPFWRHGDFWVYIVLTLVGLGVGIAGLVYAVRAFKEAQLAKIAAENAKHAATEAGRTVRVQTVAIELGEVSQKLERLRPKILFVDARDLLNEISKRIRRNVSPFAEDPALKTTIAAVRQALDAAQKSLNDVRPATPENESDAPNAVFNGIEADFALIGNLVADLLGLVEKQTFDSGVGHGKP
jgi:hypothetical protein